MSNIHRLRSRTRLLAAALVGALIFAVGQALFSALGARGVERPMHALQTVPDQPAAMRDVVSGEAQQDELAVRFDPMFGPQGDIERLIIRNATLSMTVDDVAERAAQISALAVEMGGWVVSVSSSSGSDGRVTGANLVVRVPAARLDDALAQIKRDVVRVNSEQVAGADVTQEYIDLSARLGNLEAAERQLQTIMDTADSTEAVLAVFDELTSIRGEIESLRGRVQYLEQASAFSSITISLAAVPVTQPVEVAGWRPLDTVRDAAQTLIDVLQGAADVLIFAVVFVLPLLLIAVLVVWIGRRVLRLRRAAATAAAEQAGS